MEKYYFKGEVIRGQRLGHKLGFPTANLDSKLFPTLLDDGVYSAEVIFANDKKKYLGVLFFGPKATFDEVKNTLEVHILDFDKDIYGEVIDICLVKFIRNPRKFSSVKDLVEQIKLDILSI